MKKISVLLSLVLLCICLTNCSSDGSSEPIPTLFANDIPLVPRSNEGIDSYGAGSYLTPANATDPMSKNRRIFKLFSDDNQQVLLDIVYPSGANINGTYLLNESNIGTASTYGICLLALNDNWPLVVFGGNVPAFASGTVTITDKSPMINDQYSKKFKIVFNNVTLKANEDPLVTQTITGYIETNFMRVW